MIDGSPIAGDELPLFTDETTADPKKTAHKIEITEVTDENGDGAIDSADVELLIKNHKNTLTTLKIEQMEADLFHNREFNNGTILQKNVKFL